MPLNKSKKVSEPVSNIDYDAAAFQHLTDKIASGWKKFWSFLFEGNVTFEEFLTDTGTE